MPLREKAKNFFKRRTSQSDSLSKTSSKESSRDRWPSNVYKPGESMPKPKYRRPPEKAHKDKLDSFSFGEAWRRKSFQSQHSPMGTRLPSRRNSFLDFRKGLASRNASRNASRSASVASNDNGGAKHKDKLGRRPPRLSAEVEQDGDDDPANGKYLKLCYLEVSGLTVTVVGGSHLPSVDRDLPLPPRTAKAMSNDRNAPHTMITAHDHQPFSESDLAMAIKRSHLTVPAQ